MKDPLVIRKVDNSLILNIGDIAEELGLAEGDTVVAVRTPRGFEITPCGASFDKAVASVRDVMLKYTNAMKKLAD